MPPFTPPSPAPYAVADNVGVLTNAQKAAMEVKLAQYEAATHHQVVVWIGLNTMNEAPQTFCPRAFEAWGVGRAGFNDGVVLFVFTQDDVRGVVVGAGLTQAIPDAEATRIAASVVAPKVRVGDYNGGIWDGVNAIVHDIEAWEKK